MSDKVIIESPAKQKYSKPYLRMKSPHHRWQHSDLGNLWKGGFLV